MKIVHPTQLDHHQIVIQILKNEPLLKARIAHASNISEEKAGLMLVEVLRFLHLTVWSQKTLTPPLLLDMAWHELILFTRLYDRLCHQYFGRFIHHQPGGSETENRSQLRATLKLYQLCFGAPNPNFWGDQGYYGEDVKCGACQSVQSQNKEMECILPDH